jgi:hypothetical protein
MMYMADTETSINRNYRDSQQAYFASAAGLQEVRQRLMTGSPNPLTFVPTRLPNHNDAASVVYVRNWGNGVAKSNITPWDMSDPAKYPDTEFCHENFTNAGTLLVANTSPCAAVPTGTYYTNVDSNMPGTLGTGANVPYRWVRVTLKANNTSAPYYVTSSAAANNIPICWDGFNQAPKPAGYATCDDDPPPGPKYLKSVYVLTSLAVIPNSNARRMVQMEVANDPPFITNAALDTDDLVNVHGSSVTVNGFDNCKCSCVPGSGSHPPSCTDRVTHAACTGNTYAIYSSHTVEDSGNPALVAGTNPAVAENQQFPYDVLGLIDKYSHRPGAVNVTGAPYNQHCTPQTPPAFPDCGTLNSSLGTVPAPFPPTNPNNPVGAVNQITYVPGSVRLESHTTGAGVLVVDGDLTIHGGLEFYGLIIVRGVLTFSGSGNGQDVNVLGAIITGQSSIADDTLGGGINIQFDRCALLHNVTPAPPSLLSTHELSY